VSFAVAVEGDVEIEVEFGMRLKLVNNFINTSLISRWWNDDPIDTVVLHKHIDNLREVAPQSRLAAGQQRSVIEASSARSFRFARKSGRPVGSTLRGRNSLTKRITS